MGLKGAEIGEFSFMVIKPFLDANNVHIGNPREVIVNRVDDPGHQHPHLVLSTTYVH